MSPEKSTQQLHDELTRREKIAIAAAAAVVTYVTLRFGEPQIRLGFVPDHFDGINGAIAATVGYYTHRII